jgi:hypothetical protein
MCQFQVRADEAHAVALQDPRRQSAKTARGARRSRRTSVNRPMSVGSANDLEALMAVGAARPVRFREDFPGQESYQ